MRHQCVFLKHCFVRKIQPLNIWSFYNDLVQDKCIISDYVHLIPITKEVLFGCRRFFIYCILFIIYYHISIANIWVYIWVKCNKWPYMWPQVTVWIIERFIQKHWFFQKWNNWATNLFTHWFAQKHWCDTVSFIQFVQKTDSFRHKTSELVIELLNWFIPKKMIHSVTKQMTSFTNESLNNWILIDNSSD